VAPGTVRGTVYRYDAQPDETRSTVAPSQVEAEVDRLEAALDRAASELEAVHDLVQERLGAEGRAIVEAQQLMLEDPEILEASRTRIRTHHDSAEHALRSVLAAHRDRIEASESQYLQERVVDLVDMEQRLHRALQQNMEPESLPEAAVVVAPRLTTTDVLGLHQAGMVGYATGEGGLTSHASIVARALNVPALVGLGTSQDAVEPQTPVLLDGTRGRLVLHPSPDAGLRPDSPGVDALPDVPDGPLATADGHAVTVQANVEFGGAVASSTAEADGIGLMRTEMVFLAGQGGTLAEDEQMRVYREAAQATGAGGTTIRLLDLGGDKMRLSETQEENPALGTRGIRLLLDRPELLRPQLRAVLRANAHGTLRLLLPMVTEVGEVERVRSILREEEAHLSQKGIQHDPDLPVGVLVEIPAAALRAGSFASAADFLSLGTNDLTQYVLAVERGSQQLARHHDALHPAVLRLIREVSEAGADAGTPVTICGEVAADPVAVPVLLGAGLDRFSVAPTELSTVRRALACLSWTETRSLAEEVVGAPDAPAVRDRVVEWMASHAPALSAFADDPKDAPQDS
jgi:phosphotransferase system enzyme I (PtsI)